MSKLVYKKAGKKNIRKIVRFFGLGLSLSGFIFGLYIFFPLISWELYLKPVFASQSYIAPIPKTSIITKDYLNSLLANTANVFNNVDYNNNWLPPSYKQIVVSQQISSYLISIPKLGIDSATVTTVDTDLSQHLVNFPGTAIPPNKGNAAIFGHSTLPQWFDPKNYKAIFATLHTIKVGDAIIVTTNNLKYSYKIFNISIVDAEDTSYLAQQYDDSYLTIITCTPPGTTWKRLIIKSRLEKI